MFKWCRICVGLLWVVFVFEMVLNMLKMVCAMYVCLDQQVLSWKVGVVSSLDCFSK